MTSRELLVAAARGGEVERKPVIEWPGSDPSSLTSASDAVIVGEPRSVSSYAGGDKPVLAEIWNPFYQGGKRLLELARQDPDAAASELDRVTAEVKQAVDIALSEGADGIFYRLYGARTVHTTPMEYGGLYLERDREVLEHAAEATLNVLFVLGKEDTYIDFVSDLPAHVFAWDRDASGYTAAQVRALRQGAQASSDLDSEITLLHPGIVIADRLDRI